MLPVDPDTERLARKLAEATGKTLPAIVREAIAAKAEAVGVTVTGASGLSRDELLAQITAITDEFARLPVRDTRTADEIIGYDEHGLPN